MAIRFNPGSYGPINNYAGGKAANIIKSSEEEQAKQKEEQAQQIQNSLGDIKLRNERAFKQFDLRGLSKIPSLQRLETTDISKASGLMPVLPLPKPGHIWAEVNKADIDDMLNQQNQKICIYGLQ